MSDGHLSDWSAGPLRTEEGSKQPQWNSQRSVDLKWPLDPCAAVPEVQLRHPTAGL